MTPHELRAWRTARRSVGWAVFFAFLVSPLGSYLYVGRPWRILGFVAVFSVGMGGVGYAVDTFGWPMWAADAAVGLMAAGAIADQVLLILRSRRWLVQHGRKLPHGGS